MTDYLILTMTGIQPGAKDAITDALNETLNELVGQGLIDDDDDMAWSYHERSE